MEITNDLKIGLWLKDGQKGKYFSGQVGDYWVTVSKNDFKTEDKQPDYNLRFKAKDPNYVKKTTENTQPQIDNFIEQVENITKEFEDEVPF